MKRGTTHCYLVCGKHCMGRLNGYDHGYVNTHTSVFVPDLCASGLNVVSFRHGKFICSPCQCISIMYQCILTLTNGSNATPPPPYRPDNYCLTMCLNDTSL